MRVPDLIEKWYPEMIENYQGDCSTKELLLSVYDSRQPGCPIVCKVSDLSYVVLGIPSTNNPLGYAHVKNNKTGLFCCSKDSACSTFAAKGKYELARKFCSHLHALFCAGVSVSTDNPTCTETPQESQPSQPATSILSDLSLQDLSQQYGKVTIDTKDTFQYST